MSECPVIVVKCFCFVTFLLYDRLCQWNQLWRCCFLHFVHSPPVSSVFRLWFSCNKVTKLCNPLVFYAWLLFHFINWGSWIVLAVLISQYFVKLLISYWPICFYHFYWYCLLLLSLFFFFFGPELNHFFTSQQKV